MARDRDEQEDDDPENPEASDMDEDDDDDEGPDLVECPRCGAEVAEYAQRCPRCGTYLSEEDATRRKPPWVVITATVLVLAILAAWVLWGA